MSALDSCGFPLPPLSADERRARERCLASGSTRAETWSALLPLLESYGAERPPAPLPKRIVHAARLGVPPALRSRVWPRLALGGGAALARARAELSYVGLVARVAPERLAFAGPASVTAVLAAAGLGAGAVASKPPPAAATGIPVAEAGAAAAAPAAGLPPRLAGAPPAAPARLLPPAWLAPYRILNAHPTLRCDSAAAAVRRVALTVATAVRDGPDPAASTLAAPAPSPSAALVRLAALALAALHHPGAGPGNDGGPAGSAPDPFPSQGALVAEEAAFWTLYGLATRRLPAGWLSPDGRAAAVEARVAAELAASRERGVAEAARQLGVPLERELHGWFAACFSDALPPESAARVLDAACVEGARVLLRVALHLLREHGRSIATSTDPARALCSLHWHVAHERDLRAALDPAPAFSPLSRARSKVGLTDAVLAQRRARADEDFRRAAAGVDRRLAEIVRRGGVGDPSDARGLSPSASAAGLAGLVASGAAASSATSGVAAKGPALAAPAAPPAAPPVRGGALAPAKDAAGAGHARTLSAAEGLAAALAFAPRASVAAPAPAPAAPSRAAPAKAPAPAKSSRFRLARERGLVPEPRAPSPPPRAGAERASPGSSPSRGSLDRGDRSSDALLSARLPEGSPASPRSGSRSSRSSGAVEASAPGARSRLDELAALEAALGGESSGMDSDDDAAAARDERLTSAARRTAQLRLEAAELAW